MFSSFNDSLFEDSGKEPHFFDFPDRTEVRAKARSFHRTFALRPLTAARSDPIALAARIILLCEVLPALHAARRHCAPTRPRRINHLHHLAADVSPRATQGGGYRLPAGPSDGRVFEFRPSLRLERIAQLYGPGRIARSTFAAQICDPLERTQSAFYYFHHASAQQPNELAGNASFSPLLSFVLLTPLLTPLLTHRLCSTRLFWRRCKRHLCCERPRLAQCPAAHRALPVHSPRSALIEPWHCICIVCATGERIIRRVYQRARSKWYALKDSNADTPLTRASPPVAMTATATAY